MKIQQPKLALLRGINVGGKNILPMAELRTILTARNEFEQVSTYLQTGNVIFNSRMTSAEQLQTLIAQLIKQHFDLTIDIIVITSIELQQSITKLPYQCAEGKFLLLYFLSSYDVNPDWPAINVIKAIDEECTLQGRVFYLHAPGGLARSKLASKVEKLLATTATARNLNTVRKLVHLINQNRDPTS